MELTFQKSADRWVAEFEASADFNLHIEGVVEGNVSLFQRGTASGAYAYVKDATPSPSYSRCYDYDFTSLVYPKFIKVSCATEPTYAEVISSGEVTELKFQEKAVEITANGTHTIAPDAGFAALNAVSVKVNVATSGGGSASGADEWIVAIGDENGNPNVGFMVASLGFPQFFPKGDSLQIVENVDKKFVSITTPKDDLSYVYQSFVTLGAAIKRGATMNDMGDGKIRTFNNEEDYKNILLDMCLSSGYDVTMADVENSVKFLSQNELMAMMANYGA